MQVSPETLSRCRSALLTCAPEDTATASCQGHAKLFWESLCKGHGKKLLHELQGNKLSVAAGSKSEMLLRTSVHSEVSEEGFGANVTVILICLLLISILISGKTLFREGKNQASFASSKRGESSEVKLTSRKRQRALHLPFSNKQCCPEHM